MKFYEVLHRAAEILAEDNAEKLFDYIIHSMDDDGGFLRTRWKRFEKTLCDGEFSSEPKILLAALKRPFDFKNDTSYYREETGEYNAQSKDGGLERVTVTDILTVLKMQIFYVDLSDEEHFINEAEWSSCVGYPYPIRVNIEQGTAEYLDKVEIF